MSESEQAISYQRVGVWWRSAVEKEGLERCERQLYIELTKLERRRGAEREVKLPSQPSV